MPEFNYKSILLVKQKVLLYTLPPRQSNRGYRAADWSLDSPTWTGRLRVGIRDDGCDEALYICLEDSVSGKLYAECPVETFPGVAVEPVLDSSRYFVIRLVSGDGRTMFVGMGFEKRTDAFDLNVTIQDHFKHLQQAKDVDKLQVESASSGSQSKLDLSFKEGQRIRLNLNTRRSGDATEGTSGNNGARTCPTSGLVLGAPTAFPNLLPPPPAVGGGGSRNRQKLRGTTSSSVPQPLSPDADLSARNP